MSTCWKLSSVINHIEKKYPVATRTTEHPLQTLIVDPLSGILDGSDPLNEQFSVSNDPLNVKQAEGGNDNFTATSPLYETESLTWEDFRSNIFARFQTKQQLTLASSFLSSLETDVKFQSTPDRVKGSGQTGVERVRARLEQLDSLDEGTGGSSSEGLREMGGLTQEQFTQHLMALREEMRSSWNAEQRVKSLKIAIQCVKSLALSAPELFYPCKFMIISDILDILGSLVYKRLTQLIRSSSSLICDVAKLEAEETARNWFYKVASIRELLPRLYLEAALLKCYTILEPEESRDVLLRLTIMCRGIGDPIVGAYARMYIIKSGLEFDSHNVHNIRIAIEELANCIKWGWNGQGIEAIEIMKEDIESGRVIAERVFTPPLHWLMQCLCKSCSSEDLYSVLRLSSAVTGVFGFIFVMSLLKTFPPSLIAANSCTLCQNMLHYYNFGEHPHELIIKLATIVNKVPPSEDSKLKLLNGAWHQVSQIQAINHFLKAASAWVQFAATHFTWCELDKIIGDILKRLSKFTSTDPHGFYPDLLHLITTLLTYCSHTDELCNLSSFHGLLSIFHRETMGSGSVGRSGVGVGEMKILLDTALTNHSKEFTNPTVIHLLLSLFSSLHDGINTLTTQDEKRQISQLISIFIHQVNFGRDFERQLEFYVDCRASFSSLDYVLEALVQHVCRLQVCTMNIVQGRHTSKTASFERACTAYCFITIPSLSSPVTRLKLYLVAGSIAMTNSCMGQGDACIKSAVREVLDMSSELCLHNDLKNNHLSFTVDDCILTISSLSSYLIAIPDPPDCSHPLYLYRGLANAVRCFNFYDPVLYCKLNLAILKGVCCSTRNVLPYSLKDVDGNNILYGGDLKLKSEAENICTEILAEILLHLTKSSITCKNTQFHLFCDLLETVFAYGDLCDSKMTTLASGLIVLIGNRKDDWRVRYETRLADLTSS